MPTPVQYVTLPLLSNWFTVFWRQLRVLNWAETTTIRHINLFVVHSGFAKMPFLPLVSQSPYSLASTHSSIPLCSPCAYSKAGVATVSLMSNPLTLGEHCIAALMQGWILECGAWREAYRIRKKEKGKRKKELRRERSQNHTWDRRKKRGLGDNIRLHWRVRRIKLQSSLLNVCWDKKTLIWMEVVQVQAHCGMQ